MWPLRNSFDFLRFNRWSNSPPGEREQAVSDERTADGDTLEQCVLVASAGSGPA